jgi:hypothetical protein
VVERRLILPAMRLRSGHTPTGRSVAEHPPAHNGGPAAAERFRDHLVVDTGLAVGESLQLAEARRRKRLLMKPLAPLAEGYSRVWFGPVMKPSRPVRAEH